MLEKHFVGLMSVSRRDDGSGGSPLSGGLRHKHRQCSQCHQNADQQTTHCS